MRNYFSKPKKQKSLKETNQNKESVYKAPDGIVEIITTSNDSRFPRHEYQTAIILLRPEENSRCRSKHDCVELMPTFSEVQGLLTALSKCDPGFKFEISQSSAKPEARKVRWQKWNYARIAANRSKRNRR